MQTVQLNNTQLIVDRLMRHEDHLSYSSISAFKEAPCIFIDYKLGQKVQTDAMIFGAMVHCLILEPLDFDNRYFCLEDADICAQIGGAKPRATNQYKAWKEVAMQEADGKTIVETNDAIAARIMAGNVLNNRASKKVLDLAWQHEKGIEWEFKNFKFKGFIDGIGEKIIIDLKTCADAEPEKFQRDIIQRGYYLQAAMYMYAEGGLFDYYIIAVDKNKGVSVHKLEKHLIEHGMAEYIKLLDHFNHCIITDSFHQSYDFWAKRVDGIYTAEKPKWMY